jgi:NADH-quinone oxidoreductase subunit F
MQPTVVNNVETLAAVSLIVNNSGADYAKIGIVVLQGIKLISAGTRQNPVFTK